MLLFNETVIFFTLILFRISGIFFFSPFFSSLAINGRVRVGFSFFVSFLIYNIVPKSSIAIVNMDFLIYAMLLIKELFIGALLGFLVAVVFSTIQTASQIYSMNMGLMMASAYDPLSQNQTPVLGQLKNLFVLALFFIYGIHRLMILRIIDTFYYSPIGQITYNVPQITEFFIKQFAYYFFVAIQISLPVIGVLLLIDMTLGILSRIAPQMNVFFIGMPLKLLVGFIVLSSFAPYFVNFYTLVFEKLNSKILELFKISMF